MSLASYSVCICLALPAASGTVCDEAKTLNGTLFFLFCFFNNMLPYLHGIMYATHPEQSVYWSNAHICQHGAEKFSDQHKPCELKDKLKKSVFLCGTKVLGRTNTVKTDGKLMVNSGKLIYLIPCITNN